MLALRDSRVHLGVGLSDSNRLETLPVPGRSATCGEEQKERCGEWHLLATSSIYESFYSGVAETSRTLELT